MTTQLNKKAPASKAEASQPKRGQHDNTHDFTSLTWFFQQGAHFVRVAAWNAKVKSPGKQPVENAWQTKPRDLKDILSHVKSGGNVGLLCGKPSGGLCLLDVDDHLQDFLEYFPGLKNAPIIQRKDAPNRGKIVLKMIGDLPKNKKWHGAHLEFLSTGNQGVIPPSRHPSGAIYELINISQFELINPDQGGAMEFDGERLMRICEIWTEAQAEKPTATPTPAIVDNGRGRPSRQTKDFLEFGAGPHTRNNRLFVAACDLSGCGYSQGEAEMMLLPVWARMSKEEQEAKATIASAYSQQRTPANPHAFEAGSYRSKPAPVIVEASDVEESEESAPASPAMPFQAAMPELPKIAQLSEAQIKQGRKAGKFIDDYMQYAMKDAPMSPPLFHQTYALAILSSAIARRVFVSVGTSAIYPNLYIMLSAPSTLYTKTTGYKSAMKLFETAGLSHLLLPDGVTPQSLITELSNRTPDNKDWAREDKDDWERERMFAGQRAWWIDEAARLLSQFQQKHLAELLPIVLRLYECESKIRVSTQIRGRETVRNSYLTICGPTTPAALREHLNHIEHWTNGLFARFLLVSPDTAPVRVFYPDPFPVPPALAKQLNQLAFERLEQPKESALGPTPPPPAVEAQVEPEVKQHWDNYHAAMFDLISQKNVTERLHACYGRLHEKAIKIAMLLAAADWVKMAKGNPLVIRSVHWYRAQEMTEGYRASLHRVIEDASTPTDSADDILAEKVVLRVQTSARNSRRELAIDLHMQTGAKRTQLDMVIDQLLRDSVLIEKEIKGTRGPSTIRLYPSQV